MGLFALFFPLYLASSSGTFLGNPDTVFMWGVARQIARTGEFAVAREVLPIQEGSFDHLKGRDGRLYFPKGMSYSLVLAPFCLLGDAIARIADVPSDPLARAPYGMLAASLAGPLFSALEVLLIFQICLFAMSLPRAVLAAVGAGAGTLVWAASKSNFSEPFMGMLITSQMLWLLRYGSQRSGKFLVFLGMSLALLILCQPAMALLVGPPLGIALGSIVFRWRLTWRDLAKASVLAGVPLMTGLLLFGWLNAQRYGAPTTTGYWGFVPHYIPIWEGAFGFLFSPGKSIFLYSPPLILAAGGAMFWLRRFEGVALFPLGLCCTFLIVYGSIPTWHGDGAWGPRYVSPLTGILAVLAAGAIANVADRWAARRWVALVIGGALIQLIGVTTNTAAYFGLLIGNKVVLGDPNTEAWRPVLYDPQLSPVVGRGRLLLSRLHTAFSGDPLNWTIHRVDGTDVVVNLGPYQLTDLWPVRLHSLLGPSSPVRGTWLVLWALVVAASIAGGVVLWQAAQQSKTLLQGDLGHALNVV